MSKMTPVALHETRDRFAIAILRSATGRYAVARVSPDDRYYVLGYRETETEARAYANAEWRLDR